MFCNQIMCVLSFGMLLLTFAYAQETPTSGGTPDFDTTKTSIDFKSILSSVIEFVTNHILGNSAEPLSIVEFFSQHIVRAKKSENELFQKYDDMLKKKGYFKELQEIVNQMPSFGSKEKIKEKLIKVQASASKGFEKMKEIHKMKEDIRRAIDESEFEDNKFFSQMKKAFLSFDSIFLRNESKIMNTKFSVSIIIGEVLSKLYLSYTRAKKLFEMIDKVNRICTEANENMNDAFKYLQQVEAEKKTISKKKQPQALGVKDAHGSTIKDSTSVPSLLSNFACFLGVIMLIVMSKNHI